MSSYSSYNEKYLAKKLSSLEKEMLALKTRQKYLLSENVQYVSNPLRLTAWLMPEKYRESVWGEDGHSISAIIEFRGIVANNPCFGYAKFESRTTGVPGRVYMQFFKGINSGNTMQMCVQVTGTEAFVGDLYFVTNTPGEIRLIKQFEFETDEY